MKIFRRWRAVALAVLASLSFSGSSASREPGADELRWIQEVLLGPEYGGSGKICSRWVKSPTVSVYGANPSQAKLISDCVMHLNVILDKTSIKGLQLVEPNSEADIRIYFAPLNEFDELAKKHDFRYTRGNLGYFWTFWKGGNRIYKAYILLASDKLEGDWLRHFALEELTQSLGLSNDSAVYSDSIFYHGRDGGGDAQRLSDRDKKLLEFFYTHVPPGTTTEGLREAIRRHW